MMANEWQLIEVHPSENMPVLFFWRDLVFGDEHGNEVPAFPTSDARDERFSVGFYQDGAWCENNTGHDIFEEWRGQFPTHWKPIGATP